MKKICFIAASVTAVVFCGCDHTHVAEISPSEGRRDWYQDIRANYPGFKRPRLVSPGISGQTSPAVRSQAAAPEFNTVSNDDSLVAVPVDPAVEPDNKVETAAPEAKTEVKEETAAPEAKTEVKEETKAPEAKTEPVKTADATAKDKKSIEPPDPTSSEIYEVQYGDTLGALSKKFYGSVRYVNLLQKANSDIITNSNVLKPGMKLIVPKL